MAFSALFAPIEVRGIRFRNRLVMAPMTTISGEEDGSFSDQEVRYLGQRAEGGIGAIFTPACYCHKSGHAFERQVGCHRDAMIPGLKRCADEIRNAGGVAILQIHHGGNAAKEQYIGHQPLAPSAVVNRRGTSEVPRAMTESEIWTIIESFATAAGRAKRAGFDGIEIHGANTYLFQQFFSPFTNRRTDKWGMHSWDNRCRFAVETIRAVRKEVGDDYLVSYRVSPEEPDPDGYSTQETIELLNLLVEEGVDIVHVSSWEYGKGVRADIPLGTHPTRMIRDALPKAIPVIGVGGIKMPEDALRVLQDGVEFAALGQELLLDKDWGRKVRGGRENAIRQSISSEHERQTLDIPDRMKAYTRRFF